MTASVRAGSRISLALITLSVIGITGCAPRVRLALPAGAGVPLTDVAAAEQRARAACQTHPAVTADLRLSGRIDGDRVCLQYDPGYRAQPECGGFEVLRGKLYLVEDEGRRKSVDSLEWQTH